MQEINCTNWSASAAVIGGGNCAAALHGGTPSLGRCQLVCKDRVPKYAEAPALLTLEGKPAATAAKLISFTQAAATASRVPLNVLQERSELCSKCPHERFDVAKKQRWCGLCGCTLSAHSSIFNLARYVENLPGRPGYNPLYASWGCKHPERKSGKGWAR